MKKFLLLSLLCTSAIQLHATNYEETIKIKNGTEIGVSFPENQTTGYAWQLQEIDNKNIIKVEGESKFKLSELVGAPGAYEIEIEAKKPGTATFKLQYIRPWNKEVAEERAYTIIVEK